MRPLVTSFYRALAIVSICVQTVGATEPVTTDFQQVYELIKAHLPGISDKELEQAAYNGLIKQLSPKVSLVVSNYPDAQVSTGPGILKTLVLDDNLAYLRLTKIDAEIARQAGETLSSWRATNTVAGIVLDLRFSCGDDYKAAVRVADYFIDTDKILLKWGAEMGRSTGKTNAIKAPISILVNRQTAAAAEALAAILRQHHVGLILGNRTAGQTADFKLFPLANGQQLRIATNLPRLGDDKELPLNGIQPDIEVPVNPEDELIWFNDAYAVVNKSKTGTLALNPSDAAANRASRHRFNEAELVRLQKENVNSLEPPLTVAGAVEEPAKPAIQDPALARAMDLLKGLAVIRRLAKRD
jgi:hypothetical protein